MVHLPYAACFGEFLAEYAEIAETLFNELAFLLLIVFGL
jgi:hypothetical protein